MATDKPRITITLNPHVYATLKRMSELGGQPMSTIISELLDSVHEPFMRTVALLDAAAQAPQQVKDGLRESFDAVEREMYGAVGYTVAQMDWLTEQLGQPPAAADERPPAGGRAAAGAGGSSAASPGQTKGRSRKVNPHVVTRGSGTPPVPPSRATKTARGPAKTRVPAKGGKHG
jgi:hypothetical protein